MSAAHANFAWFVICANGIVGIWALVAHWVSRIDVRALWTSVVVAQVAVVVQVVLGVILYAAAGRDIGSFHVFYGVLTVIAVALGFVYARGSEWVAQNRALFYGLLSLFIMGLAIRALIQAQPV
jgi:hypothetical protein